MVWRGLLHKTAVSGAMLGSRAEDTCCCSHYCKGTENGDLARTAIRETSTCREEGSALFSMGYAHAHVHSIAYTFTELAESHGPQEEFGGLWLCVQVVL